MQRILRVSTRAGPDPVDITGQVSMVVEKSGVKEGICLVFVPGATGAVVINENEPDLLEDFKKILEKLVPEEGYKHPHNAHSHLRAMLLGPGETIPVSGGRLVLGTWQSIFLVNLDAGPREREVAVRVLGE
ncbi:MAG: secondary thiamine-phosphate synthase enzyme YjbQ [Candidatus Aenigmarchaeota archaeon]|nr:secondary thiamine-phosphate synthase enzyme YjbQ [Candidatus Aenigmarchaeota archaeon]